MPSDLIRGWIPVRAKKTRQTKDKSPVLIQSEPIRLLGGAYGNAHAETSGVVILFSWAGRGQTPVGLRGACSQRIIAP
jgi:hypothetical protein